jgi:maleate isomerase
MADGRRVRIGVVVPSFNTVVEPEFNAMCPPAVTNHVSRIEMPDTKLTSDADQEAVIESLGTDLEPALRRVMGAQPRVVVLGISIPTFWAGLAGMREMRGRLEGLAGVPVILGSQAVLAALNLYARSARIGVVTPYQPIADERVRSFLIEAGYHVVAVESLRPRRSSLIAAVGEDQFVHAVERLCAVGADLVVQVGTNLPVTDVVDAHAARLGVPIVAINTALYWLGLRTAGIADRVPGRGPPLDRA